MKAWITGFVAAVAVVFVAAPAQAAITPTKDAAALETAIEDGSATNVTGSAFPAIGSPECSDGVNNDAGDPGNYTVDFPDDPGCSSAGDNDEHPGFGGASGVPECQNGIDDDEDGTLTDFPADPQCTAPNDAREDVVGFDAPDCATAGDDDGDGDGGVFPDDPQCASADDNDESTLEACADEEDNDGDSVFDDSDPDCAFPYDDSEESVLGPPHNPAALADSPILGFPRAGASFAILSSGDAAAIAGGEGGDDNNGVTDGDHGPEVDDLVTLKVDVSVPADANCLGVDYQFVTSEDVGDDYDDSFVAELDASNFTTDGAGAVTAPNNFATIGGAPVGVNTVPLGPFAGSDGLLTTGAQTASRSVTPGPHSVFFSIWDDSDDEEPSWVAIDNLVVGRTAGQQCVNDFAGPNVTLDKKPKKKSKKKKAKFAFSADEPNATFECKLNKKKFAPCTSPTKVKAKKGKNKFAVRATDAAGNVGEPVEYGWKRKKKPRK